MSQLPLLNDPEDQAANRGLEREERKAGYRQVLARVPDEARKKVRADLQAQEWAVVRQQALERAAPDGTDGIHACAVADLHQRVEAGSLDAIFTDPPYPVEYLPCWGELAHFAVHALKPGGLLLAVTGHAWLPQIFSLMDVDGLDYRWMISLTYSIARQRIYGRGATVGWKPLLAYKRSGAQHARISNDMFHATLQKHTTRQDHHWGQDLDDMILIAEEWTRPGWRVCDPFCGGGALLVAAEAVGCEVIGADVDPAYCQLTREAINHART